MEVVKAPRVAQAFRQEPVAQMVHVIISASSRDASPPEAGSCSFVWYDIRERPDGFGRILRDHRTDGAL